MHIWAMSHQAVYTRMCSLNQRSRSKYFRFWTSAKWALAIGHSVVRLRHGVPCPLLRRSERVNAVFSDECICLPQIDARQSGSPIGHEPNTSKCSRIRRVPNAVSSRIFSTLRRNNCPLDRECRLAATGAVSRQEKQLTPTNAALLHLILFRNGLLFTLILLGNVGPGPPRRRFTRAQCF